MRRCALCDHEEAAHVPGEGCLWHWTTGEFMSRENHYCGCQEFIPRDRPAIQLSLEEDPWSTLGRQLEEAQEEIKRLKAEAPGAGQAD